MFFGQNRPKFGLCLFLRGPKFRKIFHISGRISAISGKKTSTRLPKSLLNLLNSQKNFWTFLHQFGTVSPLHFQAFSIPKGIPSVKRPKIFKNFFGPKSRERVFIHQVLSPENIGPVYAPFRHIWCLKKQSRNLNSVDSWGKVVEN